MSPVAKAGTQGAAMSDSWGLREYPDCVRKVQFLREIVMREVYEIHGSGFFTRVAAAVVFENSWMSADDSNLEPLNDLGETLARAVMPELQRLLGHPAVAYGKAVLVGSGGNVAQGAALIHPRLGRPVRAAIGGGKAVIPSNNKIGVAGSTIDVPLAHKDESWLFDYIDTMTLSVSDAPRPNEMTLFIVLAARERQFSKPRTDGGLTI